MDTNTQSSRTKWIILIGVVLVIIAIICASCVGLSYLSSSDFSNNTDSHTSLDIKGNPDETIAVLTLDGIILDAPETIYEENSVDFLVNSLNEIKDDADIRAVILVLNTPGGSTYDTARIGDKIDEVKAMDKKVVTVMEQSAASGGYWLAAKTDYIITGPETITGSVGALWDIIMYDRLLEKVGVDQVTIHNIQSPNKTIGDAETRNPESEKYKILQELANNSYERFVNVILEGRGKTKEELGKYLDGRIVDGRQAVDVGMADQLGYFDDAVDYLQEELGLISPNVEEYERERLSPFNSLFAKLNAFTPQGTESQMRMRMMYLPSFLGATTSTEGSTTIENNETNTK